MYMHIHMYMYMCIHVVLKYNRMYMNFEMSAHDNAVPLAGLRRALGFDFDVCIHTYTHIYMYTYIFLNMYRHMYMYIYMCTHVVLKFDSMYMHFDLSAHDDAVYIYTCIIYIFMYVHIHIYIYIHQYIFDLSAHNDAVPLAGLRWALDFSFDDRICWAK